MKKINYCGKGIVRKILRTFVDNNGRKVFVAKESKNKFRFTTSKGRTMIVLYSVMCEPSTYKELMDNYSFDQDIEIIDG